MERYLNILIDSQKKKLSLLDDIMDICTEHERLLNEEIPDIDGANDIMLKKKELIDELSKLDDGFVALYERISPELKKNTTDYTEKLRELKSLVEQASSKTTLIQAREIRANARLETIKNLGGTQIKLKPARADAAARYSVTMNNSAQPKSIFINRKK